MFGYEGLKEFLDLGALQTAESGLEIDIATDLASIGEGGIPTTFDGVGDFLRKMPSFLERTDHGKGVPIAFSLLPIDTVAQMFSMQVQHDIIVRRLDQSLLDDCIDLLETLEAATQKSKDYVAVLEQHRYCVPNSHFSKAKKEARVNRDRAALFKKDLKEEVVHIRSGSRDTGLRNLLGDHHLSTDDDEGSGERPVIGLYTNKIAFVDTVMDAGGKYISHESLDAAINSNRTSDLYVFHFNEAVQDHSSWSRERDTFFSLLHDAEQHCVLVVDYDVLKPKDLTKAYIELRRCGEVIVPDVCRDLQELSGLCLLRDTVCFGFTDNYLYCLCSRYPFVDAAFKCNSAVHGPAFATYDTEDLRGRLEALDPAEEYNILILGDSGVGKSTFLNAMMNYLAFDSLDEAMNDTGPLQYTIPSSFTWKEREVVVGQEHESVWERISSAGRSATRKARTYCFNLDGKIFRFIDTPGTNDTDGPDQDDKNAKDILNMLESIKKLSAVLIMFKTNETRISDHFRKSVTDLLSRLHRDTTKNILFGFTNAHASDFESGGTHGTLNALLGELGVSIAPGQANSFFFESKPFLFLAAWKQNIATGNIDKVEELAEMWTRSADGINRLIKTVMDLPTHDVSKTLKLGRTSNFLGGMAKPLAKFTTISGYDCDREACKHDWREHMQISYEFKNETREVDDEALLEEIKSNDDMKRLLGRRIRASRKKQQMIAKERAQIQKARALFYVYMRHHTVGAIGPKHDATIKYLSNQIALASGASRDDEKRELEGQKTAHEREVENLEKAIADKVTTVPDEKAVDDAIEALKKMPVFGKDLMDAVEPGGVELEESRFVFVEPTTKTKKRRWRGYVF
ncbi:hypothetical protein ACCO45_007890 [Purpureocillium lilacinum]|uniref:Uncharacterized protein n=1 Tax=Purpureocillium lilacinum TaxID=33203 RepID=A0ACC4DMI9_PURLI